MTSDTTLLEQVLRPGNPALADSASYQSIAKEYPEKASGMSYVRPDESARLSYDLVKSGKFEKAIQQAAAARAAGARLPEPRQDHSRRQAAGFLGLRQVSLARRRLQHDGRRRIHDDRLHPPPPRSVKRETRRKTPRASLVQRDNRRQKRRSQLDRPLPPGTAQRAEGVFRCAPRRQALTAHSAQAKSLPPCTESTVEKRRGNAAPIQHPVRLLQHMYAF